MIHKEFRSTIVYVNYASTPTVFCLVIAIDNAIQKYFRNGGGGRVKKKPTPPPPPPPRLGRNVSQIANEIDTASTSLPYSIVPVAYLGRGGGGVAREELK